VPRWPEVRFSHGAAAALYGAAAGVVYGGTAALHKALTTVAAHVPGVVLTQLAYQAGSLAASLPLQPVALGQGSGTGPTL
jgi:hypothetical protein